MLLCLRCGNRWTPRKEHPRKCPGCQNPNWNRELKRKRREGSSSVVERPSAKVSSDPMAHSKDDNAEGGSSVQIPASPHQLIEKDSLSEAKARAEALFRALA